MHADPTEFPFVPVGTSSVSISSASLVALWHSSRCMAFMLL